VDSARSVAFVRELRGRPRCLVATRITMKRSTSVATWALSVARARRRGAELILPTTAAELAAKRRGLLRDASFEVIGTKNLVRLQERLGFKIVFFLQRGYGDYDAVMDEDVMDKVEIRQLNDYAMTSGWASNRS
jgi:hypothetical protein